MRLLLKSLAVFHILLFQIATARLDAQVFEPNYGQVTMPEGCTDSVYAYIQIPLGTVFITEKGLRLSLINENDKPLIHKSLHYQGKDTSFTIKRQVFDLLFHEAQSPQEIRFEDPVEYYNNYFLGNNEKSWKTKVHPFRKVRWVNIYPQIDAVIYVKNNQLEFDFIVKPKAHVDQIKMYFEGQKSLKILKNAIKVSGQNADFTLNAPISYQKSKRKLKQIPTQYTVTNNIVSLKLKNFNPLDTLIIDPILVFSTYSGSTADNFGFTATYDTAGCLYAGGIVDANTRRYPVTTGAFQTIYGGSNNNAEPVYLPCDISISKYTPDGSKLLFATYLGGENNEYPHSLCTDLNNNLLVFGSTLSPDYPIHRDSFIQRTKSNSFDIVITKLNPSGSALLGSTFLGNSSDDGFQTNSGGNRSDLIFNYADNYRGDITTDNEGNIFVATCSRSTNLSVTPNGFQTNNAGRTDALVFSLSPNLSKIHWGSFFGGAEDDAAYSCRLDDEGHLFVGGGTASGNFPLTTNRKFDSTFNGFIDGFVLKLDAASGKYLNSTLWSSGLTSDVDDAYDQIYFIDLDANGKVYFTGQTMGYVFRSANVYGQEYAGQMIGRFNENLDSLEFMTTFGNSQRGYPDLSPSAFMVDDCFNIYFSGWGSYIGVGNEGTTLGLEITPDAHQSTTDNNDFYLLALSPNAKSLAYASFFGGYESEDHVDGGTSRFDKRGIVYQSVCASCPNSPPGLNDFPTSNNAVFPNNVSIRCSNASFKLDFRLGYSVDAIFNVRSPFCVTDSAVFRPQTKYNATYTWYFGDGDSSNEFSPTHQYKTPGKYKVKLLVKDTNSCNVNVKFTRVINVIVAPNANFDVTVNPCSEAIDFAANGSSFDSITWNFGDNTPPVFNENPTSHIYAVPNQIYTATAIFKNTLTGCTDTVTKILTDSSFRPKEMNIANVFTPNNDGKNDCFQVYGITKECEKAEIRIFNRWGARVYLSKDLTECWNGRVDNIGPAVPEGTYFYIIDIIESPNPDYPKKINGSVNLIRSN